MGSSFFFDLRGQFWLMHRGRTRTSRCGMSWLPASWNLQDRTAREWLHADGPPVHVLHGGSGRAEVFGRPADGTRPSMDTTEGPLWTVDRPTRELAGAR
jgi:hypothetical protein